MTADTKSSYAGRGRIDPVQAVFVDREVESAYRVAETRDVAALLGIGVIFYILAVFGIFIWDTLRGAAVPGVLWALRAVTVATGLAVVLRLRRDQNPARADVLSYIWLTLAVIAVLAGLVERERDLALTVMFISLAGFTVYWMAPGRLLAQTFLASLYTIAAALVFLLDHQSTVAEFGLAVFTVVFTNILGVAAARRWHMLRRLGFFGRIETDEARRRAEFAERTQAAFTGIMSAHLREELDALRGRIEALPEEEDEFTRRMAAMSAAASAQGLVRLLDDALAVLRRRPGDIRIEESEFPLQDVAARVISDLNDIAGAKGVEIDYVRATDLPDTVIGDEARVDYVLRSLLRRAVFVTHGGAVEFRLEPVETTPGTLRVRFAIADRGSPPALGDPDSLFLPEPSIGPDGSPVFESRALDLYRSRMIVERLGGRIDVHIGASGGTLLVVDLPFKRHRREAEDSAFRPRRVLVVDDVLLNVEIVRACLEKLGHVAESAVDGNAALALARTRHFDAALLDLRMPGMSGEALGLALMTDPEVAAQGKPEIIVAVTADAVPMDALPAGFAAVLQKPVDVASLGRVLGVAAGDLATLGDTEHVPFHPLLDLGRLARLRHDLDGPGIEMVLRSGKSFFARALAQLGGAQARGDVAGLRDTLHGLKGAALNISLRAVAEFADEIERALGEDDKADVAARLAELQAKARDSVIALDGWAANALRRP